jgi:hypothetical protein
MAERLVSRKGAKAQRRQVIVNGEQKRVGGVSDADYGLLAECGMVRVIGVGGASYNGRPVTE